MTQKSGILNEIQNSKAPIKNDEKSPAQRKNEQGKENKAKTVDIADGTWYNTTAFKEVW